MNRKAKDEMDSKQMERGDEKEMSDLDEALEAMMKCAYELEKKCSGILKMAYGEEDITFPINIERVVCAQGINLVYGNLNMGGESEIDLNIAQLLYEKNNEDEVIRKIYIDNSQIDFEQEAYSNLQKYAIAYELGKVIVGEEYRQELDKMQSNEISKLNMCSVPYSLPRLYASPESFKYEMCAIFLLLPMDKFLEEFDLYINRIEDHPIRMERWIRYLSDRTGIPNYQLINGYQYIKFCACQYYQEKSGEDRGNKYWNLYR